MEYEYTAATWWKDMQKEKERKMEAIRKLHRFQMVWSIDQTS